MVKVSCVTPVDETSPRSADEMSRTTSSTGREVSATSKVSVLPDSDTIEEPSDSVTEKPATSSSVVVTGTV